MICTTVNYCTIFKVDLQVLSKDSSVVKVKVCPLKGPEHTYYSIIMDSNKCVSTLVLIQKHK